MSRRTLGMLGQMVALTAVTVVLPLVAPVAAQAATVEFAPVAFSDSGGTGSVSVASADFDGNGVNNVATANEDSDTISVLFNTGTGVLSLGQTYPVGEQPWEIITADVNGDTRPDLVTANAISSDLSVLLNNGDGTFAPEVVYAVGFTPSGITAADVDGNGVVDLITCNLDDNNVSVLLGNGSGGFAAAVSVPVGLAPSGVTSGDVTGDGVADVVAVNSSSDSVSLLIGPFDADIGNFAEIHDLPTGFAPDSVVLADLDRSGGLDIAVHANSLASTGPDYVSVLLNSGGGLFQPAVDYPAVGVRLATGIATGDFNADGVGDIAVAGLDTSTVGVLLSDGHGHLGPAAVLAAAGPIEGLIAATITGNQGPDLVTGYISGTQVGVLANTSPFPPPPPPPPPPTPTGLFTGVAPARVFDTRDGYGLPAAGKLGVGRTMEVQVTGKFGVPATGVEAVSLNVTVTNPEGPGFVTVFPCGSLPLASNLNFEADETVPNAVIAPVSPRGTVCLYTMTTTDLLANVSGWFASEKGLETFTPQRVFDTRDGTGGVPVGKVALTQTLEIRSPGASASRRRVSPPSCLNVTATEPEGPGFVTVFPCTGVPLASNLNFVPTRRCPMPCWRRCRPRARCASTR